MTTSSGARAMTEEGELERALARLNERAWGIAMGLLLGLGLLIATLFLVIKGGQNVGAHLGLLGIFLPGYRVSVLGSLIGFMYAFVIGYAFGRMIGLIYNWLSVPSRKVS
jgi:hypothetical protein